MNRVKLPIRTIVNFHALILHLYKIKKMNEKSKPIKYLQKTHFLCLIKSLINIDINEYKSSFLSPIEDLIRSVEKY